MLYGIHFCTRYCLQELGTGVVMVDEYWVVLVRLWHLSRVCSKPVTSVDQTSLTPCQVFILSTRVNHWNNWSDCQDHDSHPGDAELDNCSDTYLTVMFMRWGDCRHCLQNIYSGFLFNWCSKKWSCSTLLICWMMKVVWTTLIKAAREDPPVNWS